uniref:CSC1/OSCA1-like 7TM region domain-containing protein n=1 Tax=Arcella intermedia TaxID=1963864 RepID=A0A6B2KZV8_9EUKA
MSWVYHIFFYDWDDFYETHGLDALIYLQFLACLNRIVILFLGFALCFTIPTFLTASRQLLPPSDPMRVSGTATISLSNINSYDSHDRNRYWTTFLSVYFNSFVSYFFLYKVYCVYHYYRLKLKSKIASYNLTVRISDVPQILTDEQVYDKLNKIFPGKLHSVERVLELSNIERMVQLKKSLERERSRLIAMGEDNANTTTCLLFVCFKAKRDNIDKLIEQYDFRISDVSDQIALEQQNIDFYEPTPVIYVTFKDLTSARICAQSALDRDPFSWKTAPAPDPADIEWSNHYLIHFRKKIQYYVITVIVCFINLSWFVPVGFALSIGNLKVLASIFGHGQSVDEFSKNNPKILMWIEGIIPAVIIWIFYLILMPLLRYFTYHQGWLSKSKIEEFTLHKFFAFVIINIFLTSLLAGTAFDVWQQLVYFAINPPQFFPLVALAVPGQVNYFINYILLNSVFAYSIQLLRPWWIFLRGIAICCAYSEEEFEEANKSEEFDYPYYYGMHILFFLVILTYSSIAPLMIPFGLIYFGIAYFVHIHNMVFVTKQSFEGFGNLWPTVFSQACFVLGMYQTILMTLLSMNGFYWSFLLSPSIFITYTYWNYLNKNLFFLCDHGPLDLPTDEPIDPQCLEQFKTLYLPPGLKA